jgi:hypothetical protein
LNTDTYLELFYESSLTTPYAVNDNNGIDFGSKISWDVPSR